MRRSLVFIACYIEYASAGNETEAHTDWEVPDLHGATAILDLTSEF